MYRPTKRGTFYKPKPTRDYQLRCKQYAMLAARGARWPQFETVKRARLSYDLYSNADADSALKVTMDALQGVLYANDRVVEVGALRAFPVKRGEPRSITVTVEVLE